MHIIVCLNENLSCDLPCFDQIAAEQITGFQNIVAVLIHPSNQQRFIIARRIYIDLHTLTHLPL